MPSPRYNINLVFLKGRIDLGEIADMDSSRERSALHVLT